MRKLPIAIGAFALSTAPALAHVGVGAHDSFAAGFAHPLSGLDHMLAMVAVGLWAVLIAGDERRRWALWLVPAAFVGVMATGFAAGLGGLPLPFVEPMILASVLVLGVLSALAVSVPVAVGMLVVGFFAFFHGHAHGEELAGAGALPFALGFALATALLHGLGIGVGTTFGGAAGRRLARAVGAATVLGGVWLAMGG